MQHQRQRLALMVATLLAISLPPSAKATHFSHEAAQVGPSEGPSVTSPEVAADRSVTFRVLAPKAAMVRLEGTDIPGNPQPAPLSRDEHGLWSITLGPLPGGAYRYRFDVDGVAVVDPRNPATSESNEHSWSLVVVPGADFLDAKDVPRGAVAEVEYYSKALKQFRRMHVYTPPGYESGTGQFPTLYLLHGALDCDDSWTSVGRAGFILDNLIAARKAEPMLVVMPDGHTGPWRFGMSFDIGPFVDDFTGAVVPYVESRYRVHADRAHRAIAGLSMGGWQALEIGVTRLESFAYVGVFSSGIFGIAGRPGEGDAGPSWVARHRDTLDAATTKEGLKLIWFATGKDDFLVETSRAAVQTLKAHGFDVAYVETAGGHTWLNWRDYLYEFAQKLFR